MIEVVDLAFKKRILEEGPFNFGDTITFVNTIFNQGNIVLDSIRIRDYMPDGYSFPADVNSTWTLNGSDNIETEIDAIEPGQSVTLDVSFQIVLCDNYEADNYKNESEITSFEDKNNEDGDDIDSTPDDIPGDPVSEDDSDTEILVFTSNLGGDVWKDLDMDGIQDTNEPAVLGMTVDLLDYGGNFISSATTGFTGFYVFTNLPVGNYQVQFDINSLAESCVYTQADAGNNDEIDSDADNDGFVPCTAVTVGSENYTLDAGLIEPLGSIGDLVFTDLDADRVQGFGE